MSQQSLEPEAEPFGRDTADHDVFRLLDTAGTLIGPDSSAPEDVLLAGFRLMLFSRHLDERVVSLQRQGRIGTFATASGQEAVVAGCALALDRTRDWLVPQYRESAALVQHGYPLESLLLFYMGNPAGCRVPDDVKVLPVQIALAAQLPHAVGLGWGLRLRGLDGVVLTFCGDGASSEGDFHEALNFAGVLQAPVVFVLVNNGYAISTPRSLQTAARTFASRATGYGIAGQVVDGNDMLAVHASVVEAVRRARQASGPTLLEVQTYRLASHNTADDHTRYVDAAELDLRRQQDPIPRMRAYLRTRGLLTEDAESAIVVEIEREISAAITSAEAHPRPTAAQIFDHAYERPPSRFVDQRRTWITEHFRGES